VCSSVCEPALHAFGPPELAELRADSESAIYRHFESKTELFSAAVVEPFDALLTEYEAFF
jgi:hypothetical protein